MKHCIFILFYCSCNLLATYAQTVTWSIPPTYPTLEEYGDVYKVREHGKVGLVSRSGQLLIRPDYDSITPFNEQLALALEIQNNKYIVKAIISHPDYKLSVVNERFYVPKNELYFCDKKLAVYDDRNLYGYLQSDGSVFILCQYARTFPFYEGVAYVEKSNNKVAYLQSDGNELPIEIERQGYMLTNGTAFNEEGKACIQARLAGTKTFIIDTKGKILFETKILAGNRVKGFTFRKLPFEFQPITNPMQPQNGIIPFEQGKLYGYVTADNKRQILAAQFTEAYPFIGGYAKVKTNGKYGILQLQSGGFTGQIDKNNVEFRNGKGEMVNYTVTIPASYCDKSIQMTVKEGGISKEVPLNMTDGTHASFTFIPMPDNQEEEMNFHFSLSSDGLLLWEDEQKLTIKYVKDMPPVLSAPQITSAFSTDSEGYVRADSDNKVDIYTTLTNPSSSTLHISITIEGNGVKKTTLNLSVPPESNKTVTSIIQDIKERKPVKVTVRTSTGLEQSSIIKVKPFI